MPLKATTIEESLKTLDSTQKVDLKSTEIEKVGAVAQERVQFSRADYKIEIISIKKRVKGVEVLAKAWMPDGTPIGFGRDGSVEIERFIIGNPPVLVLDINGTIERTHKDPKTGDIVSKFREDPKAAILQTLAHTISVKKEKFTDKPITKGKIGSTTLTQHPVAGSGGSAPIDGQMLRIAAGSWSTIINGAGTHVFDATSGSQAFIEGRATSSPNFNVVTRSCFGFDTSSIGTDTISSAVLSLWSLTDTADTDFGEDPNCDIVSADPVSESVFATGDYAIAKWGTTIYAADSFSNYRASVGGYHDFTLDSNGITYIDPDANTMFGARYSRDTSGSAPTWTSNDEARINCYYADEAGTTNDPKLVVEHSAAGTHIRPPAAGIFSGGLAIV